MGAAVSSALVDYDLAVDSKLFVALFVTVRRRISRRTSLTCAEIPT